MSQSGSDASKIRIIYGFWLQGRLSKVGCPHKIYQGLLFKPELGHDRIQVATLDESRSLGFKHTLRGDA